MFELLVRLHDNIGPSNNRISLSFPDQFYEIFIDKKSFQHKVQDVRKLPVGEHVRFAFRRRTVMGFIQRFTRRKVFLKLSSEDGHDHVVGYDFGSITDVCTVPMLTSDIIEDTYGGDLQWTEDDADLAMHPFTGNGDIQMDNCSVSEAFWSQFKIPGVDLLVDYYQKATNAWASERKAKAIAEGKLGSWWLRWPDEGIDVQSIKIDMVLTWAANLEGKSFESFFSDGIFGHNKKGGCLENIPYYKFALVHCARRVHTPAMRKQAMLVKENAPYRYDKLWGFADFFRDFFKIANHNKGMSRDIDVDESVKKASSKKGRTYYSFYPQKNNDYGYGMFGLNGRLSEPVGSFKGVGYCHNLLPEASYQAGPWAWYSKGYDVCMQLLTSATYPLGKGHCFAMDNRYTSCNLLMDLQLQSTNAFGTVRANRKYLPQDCKEMYNEAKEYGIGEYQTRFSDVAKLAYFVVRSSKVVRLLSNCHSTTSETDLYRFVAPDDNPHAFNEAPLGRREVTSTSVLLDYSLTMNNTDCSDGLRGRMTKYNRHSVRMSQPLLDYISFEKAPVNAFILYRGLNPSYRKGIRQFAEDVIQETLKPFLDGSVDCWIRRKNKRKLLSPDEKRSRHRFRRRFTGKPIKDLSCLEIRNEFGPIKRDPDVDPAKRVNSVDARKSRASICMDLRPAKVEKSKRSRCLMCMRWTQFYCTGARCKVWACYFGSGFAGSEKDTCLGKLHTRLWIARAKLTKNL